VLRTEVKRSRRRAVYRVTGKMPTVSVELSFLACGMADERWGAVMALSHLLGGSLSSRLFTRVREELGLVYEVWSFPIGYSDSGALNVALSVDATNLVPAVRAALQVVEECVEDGLSKEELERYKESVRCGIDILTDRPHALADWLARQEVILGPEQLITPEEFVARQEALTREGTHRVIRDVLGGENANMAVVGPYGAEQTEALRELFPAEEPPEVNGAL
jgi:predicted Zn-dependent peptidase